jgi:PadR family transcriptional regulator, regulatory protein AphA
MVNTPSVSNPARPAPGGTGGERSPSIEYSLLGLLGERPMHGYELYRELCRKSGLGLVWTVKQAQLYGILARLESAALVASELVVSGQRPARKVFHLTEEGRAAFDGWVSAPAGRRDFRLDFPAKLLFARKAGARAAAALVSAQRRSCASWLDDMRSRGAACEAGSLDELFYRYRIGQLEAAASWLELCASYVGRVRPAAKAGAAGATAKKSSKGRARAASSKRNAE